MILPAKTLSPPNFLTPNLRPAESRPFLELPPAFLCAIFYQPLSQTPISRRDLYLIFRRYFFAAVFGSALVTAFFAAALWLCFFSHLLFLQLPLALLLATAFFAAALVLPFSLPLVVQLSSKSLAAGLVVFRLFIFGNFVNF